ncbi:AAA family ATPase [Sphaerisporangium sp. NBC_01403]|uniref:AAA family ATPase n=1 Tax=Sphaerisporangium sp. NBC_01403 TaxID=2903599 RepID=UPI00386E9012
MLYVVTGPPAAGKSTWVREHAKPGDVVVDYDLIAGALSGPTPACGGTHDHRGAVRDVAFRARSAAIREALRHAADIDVYIIHTLPPADALAKYAEHRAHLVTIDPGHDVVMQRIAEQRPSTARAVAKRWYSQAAKGQHGATTATPWQGHPPGTPHPLHAPPPTTSRTW